MTIIYHIAYCDEYEADAFFDTKHKLLAAWSMNDANWRSEYMNPLLEALGVEVVQIEEEDLEYKSLVKKMKKYLGS